MITGFRFSCPNCQARGQYSVLWFVEVGIKRDGTFLLQGLCFTCGRIADCKLTPDEQVEAMLESTDGEEDEPNSS